jgi:translation initiation factor 2 beta subunit (eIF-2beta)/eIF-5
VDDMFERYKMPLVELRQKPQGQYNSTYIMNLVDIVKALKTEPEYMVKYIGAKLGVKATLMESEELHLKGLFGVEEMLEVIRGYIGEYVLCKSCTLPELDYSGGKTTLLVKCRSCGYRSKCDKGDRIYKIMYQRELAKLVKSTESGSMKDTRDEMEQELKGMELEETDETDWSVEVTEEALEARRIKAIGDSGVMSNLLQ